MASAVFQRKNRAAPSTGVTRRKRPTAADRLKKSALFKALIGKPAKFGKAE